MENKRTSALDQILSPVVISGIFDATGIYTLRYFLTGALLFGGAISVWGCVET